MPKRKPEEVGRQLAAVRDVLQDSDPTLMKLAACFPTEHPINKGLAGVMGQNMALEKMLEMAVGLLQCVVQIVQSPLDETWTDAQCAKWEKRAGCERTLGDLVDLIAETLSPKAEANGCGD